MTFQSTYDKKIHGKISETLIELSLMEYSMRLERILAVGSDTVQQFEATVESELVEIEEIRDLLSAKEKLIQSKSPEYSVGQSTELMTAILREYRSTAHALIDEPLIALPGPS